MKSLLKAALAVIALLLIWNALTCQYCSKGKDVLIGEAGTASECSVDGSNSLVTRSAHMVGWEVHVYIPFVGCFVNDPTPQDVFGVRVEGWFKGWHQVKIVHLKLK